MLYEASDRAGERPVAQRLHTVLVYKAVGLYDAFSGKIRDCTEVGIVHGVTTGPAPERAFISVAATVE